MLDDLNLLARLQEIDNSLQELVDEKGDLPDQLALLKKDLSRLEDSIAKAEGELSANAARRQQFDRGVEEAKERLKKSQGTIFSVKTTREYDAISSEIEQAKHQIADFERQLLELTGSEDVLKREIIQLRDKYGVVLAENEERRLEMQERMGQSEGEELTLSHEREKIVVRLKRPVYAHYERIRKIRDGVGVSHLSEGACSYCYSMIPPQRQAEVRRMDDVILCEVCGCIMVS
ncbi:MAG: hypothetical protein FJY67_02475 [Calditrichaeota bacterium]|nr:hypothetical protein [Calditrichota bacterium]